VIHAGFYYEEHSLKAALCVKSNPLLYELCAKNNVPHKRLGKIVIGNTEKEIEKVQRLFVQGQKNGVPDLALLSKHEVRDKEPLINAEIGLYSPSTGIVDSHVLMKYFETKALTHGVTIGYNCRVTGLSFNSNQYCINVLDADGEEMQLTSEMVINCAGLSCDEIAAMVGIDVAANSYTIHPCKGEYFNVAAKHRNKLSHLVYPAPTPISLGIHAVLKLDGSLKLGPNAFYVTNKEDYTVDPAHREGFFATAKAYLPFLEYNDLSPDMSGIRPKTQGPGDAARDFIIREERDKGLPGLINLIGIESPGLTSAVGIAEMVNEMI
jgi:L-2-hydroxyglutarate oxidase LhgO